MFWCDVVLFALMTASFFCHWCPVALPLAHVDCELVGVTPPTRIWMIVVHSCQPGRPSLAVIKGSTRHIFGPVSSIHPGSRPILLQESE